MRRVLACLVVAVGCLALPGPGAAQNSPRAGGALPGGPSVRPATLPMASRPIAARPMRAESRHAMNRRSHRGAGIVPIYRPWYGGYGGGSVSQTTVIEERSRLNPYGVTSFFDVPTVAGIRSAPAGAPTTYVLHPASRQVADRSRGPRIIELDADRVDEPSSTGPRIVHIQVRRDPPRRR